MVSKCKFLLPIRRENGRVGQHRFYPAPVGQRGSPKCTQLPLLALCLGFIFKHLSCNLVQLVNQRNDAPVHRAHHCALHWEGERRRGWQQSSTRNHGQFWRTGNWCSHQPSCRQQHPCHLASTQTTNVLQPMDISANKPAKEYLRRQFEEWYSDDVMKQLDGRNLEVLWEAELQPINLGIPILKEIGAE